MKSKKLTFKKISFYITYNLDNKYFAFLNDKKELDLAQIRIDFSLFLKKKYPFIIFSDNFSHISICSDKIEKGYNENKLEEDIKEIKKYLKAYKLIIKGVSEYNMSYMTSECFIELSKQKREYDKKFEKMEKALIKLGINPEEL